jgi:hypothetical protein
VERRGSGVFVSQTKQTTANSPATAYRKALQLRSKVSCCAASFSKLKPDDVLVFE